jgi:hypothetical protein
MPIRRVAKDSRHGKKHHKSSNQYPPCLLWDYTELVKKEKNKQQQKNKYQHAIEVTDEYQWCCLFYFVRSCIRLAFVSTDHALLSGQAAIHQQCAPPGWSGMWCMGMTARFVWCCSVLCLNDLL